MKRMTLLAAAIGIAALAGCETREENVAENVDAADNMMAPVDNMDMNLIDNNVVDNNVVDNNVTDNTTNNTTGY